jgi:hypothetical protein
VTGTGEHSGERSAQAAQVHTKGGISERRERRLPSVTIRRSTVSCVGSSANPTITKKGCRFILKERCRPILK